jgi:hypothetical protein
VQLYNLTFDDFPSLTFLPFNDINKKIIYIQKIWFWLGPHLTQTYLKAIHSCIQHCYTLVNSLSYAIDQTLYVQFSIPLGVMWWTLILHM